jgi:uncharacterized glyoxalase superfamily protein PhnB
MNAHSKPMGASVIPTVRYRDVSAAVAWLHEAFGLEPHRLVKDAQGAVLYGELTFGSGMVMVAPIQDSPLGKLMVQPDEIGGVETQISYLFVEDARAHHARAKAAGAEIVLDIDVEANGGRGFSCRDLEGHVWNFGTYDPWVKQSAARKAPRPRRKVMLAFLLLAAAAGVAAHAPAREAANDLASRALAKAAAAIGTAQAEQTPDLASGDLHDLREQLSRERLARVAADRHVKDIREELAQERRARAAAELASKDVRDNPVQIQMPPSPATAAKAVDNATAEARNELAKIRIALQTATEQLAQAQKTRHAAELGAKDAREQFAQLRSARETADNTAREMRELAARERSARIAAERTLRKAKASPYTPYPLQ